MTHVTEALFYGQMYGTFVRDDNLSLSLVLETPEVICFYCGRRNKIETETCPGCGAGDWKRRKTWQTKQ